MKYILAHTFAQGRLFWQAQKKKDADAWADDKVRIYRSNNEVSIRGIDIKAEDEIYPMDGASPSLIENAKMCLRDGASWEDVVKVVEW